MTLNRLRWFLLRLSNWIKPWCLKQTHVSKLCHGQLVLSRDGLGQVVHIRLAVHILAGVVVHVVGVGLAVGQIGSTNDKRQNRRQQSIKFWHFSTFKPLFQLLVTPLLPKNGGAPFPSNPEQNVNSLKFYRKKWLNYFITLFLSILSDSYLQLSHTHKL